ncbi:Fructosamine kinase-domain-containing protein [Hypoxylon sp. FL1284]|nr:Fructosamine kinase-domain-containing protein [Hypoxylon sp. FL1284]
MEVGPDEQLPEPMVPIEVTRIIDPQVLKKLQEHLRDAKELSVVSIATHGSSLWTRTARIDTELVNERQETIPRPFFLKTTRGPDGEAMVENELRCMGLLHMFLPDLVPEPVACGAYSSMRGIYFLLCEFRSMEDKLPPPAILAPYVAELHLKSRVSDVSATFGSSDPTFHGGVCVEHGVHETWEAYFAHTMRRLFDQEQSVQGTDEAIKQMMDPFFEKVIPRLLRPLETGGRSISPSVIHGDLWHGNVGTDKKTGQPVIFDAACFRAHNEYELGVWRQDWNNINSAYRQEYHKHFPPSEPAEDCDDRNALYATRVNLLDSILYKNEPEYRIKLIAGMRELLNKFSGGFEAWEASKGTSQT